MKKDRIAVFREALIEKTKEKKLDWKPLSQYKGWNSIEDMVAVGNNVPDFRVDSIRVSNSFYLESGEGYVFLFEVFHGNPEITSPEMDTIALMVKVNQLLPIENLSFFTEEEQEQLSILQLYVEKYCDKKLSYQDTLYDFLEKVVGEEEKHKVSRHEKKMVLVQLQTENGIENVALEIDDNGNVKKIPGAKRMTSEAARSIKRTVSQNFDYQDASDKEIANRVREIFRNAHIPRRSSKGQQGEIKDNENS